VVNRVFWTSVIDCQNVILVSKVCEVEHWIVIWDHVEEDVVKDDISEKDQGSLFEASPPRGETVEGFLVLL
jgi:hypothetical protein